MKIEKDQIFLTNYKDQLRFHYLRGKGHLLAYAWNRFQWHNYPRWRRVARYPLHLDVELSSLCNMRCPMCYTTTQQFKESVDRAMMDFGLFKKIIDESARHGLFSIRLSLRGEPTAHPKMVEMLRYAKAAGIKEVSTLSNGLKMNEEVFEQLLEGGLDWLTLSIDGWGETYEKIRFPAKWEEIYRKVRAFHAIKRRKGSAKPVIKVQSVWPAIERDPAYFYNLFKPYVDEVASNPLIDFLREDSDIEYVEDFTCQYLWQRMSVGADGNIMMCQCDEMEEHVLGNAAKESIYEVWHGAKMSAIRRIHLEGKGPRTLKACKACIYPRARESAEPVALNDQVVRVERYTKRDQRIGPKDRPAAIPAAGPGGAP